MPEKGPETPRQINISTDAQILGQVPSVEAQSFFLAGGKPALAAQVLEFRKEAESKLRGDEPQKDKITSKFLVFQEPDGEIKISLATGWSDNEQTFTNDATNINIFLDLPENLKQSFVDYLKNQDKKPSFFENITQRLLRKK